MNIEITNEQLNKILEQQAQKMSDMGIKRGSFKWIYGNQMKIKELGLFTHIESRTLKEYLVYQFILLFK